MSAPRGSLDPLLKPRSIAVVGASQDPSRISARPLRFLLHHGFAGPVYPINPRASEILGIKAFPRIGDVGEPVDLAMVGVAAKLVPGVVEECAVAGVKATLILTSGFAETGEEGRRAQQRLGAIARERGIRLMGPNSMGIINPRLGAAACWSNVAELDRLLPGRIGLISHSGGLGGSVLNRAQDHHVGLSYLVWPGGEADVSSVEALQFLLDDEDTEVIALIVESIGDTEGFVAAARRALRLRKPLVVFKLGRREAGRRAVTTHTGAMAGADEVYRGAFAQLGVVQVEQFDDLYETAAFFSKAALPEGDRVGVITSSGGARILMADIAETLGLSLPSLAPETAEPVSRLIPGYGSTSNPLDITGGLAEDVFFRSLEPFVGDPNLDIIVATITMITGARSGQRGRDLIEFSKRIRKPFAVHWTAGSLSAPGFDELEKGPVPLFYSGEKCLWNVRALIRYAAKVRQEPELARSPPSVPGWLESLHGALDEYGSKRLLAHYGVHPTRERVATSAREAVVAARAIGYPVALKVLSADIGHKTESGGIRLNLTSDEAVAEAFGAVSAAASLRHPQARIRGVLVQEMVSGGVEMVAGITTDVQFGHVVMAGLGGVFAEALDDSAVRLPPLNAADARELLQELRGRRVLNGLRGGPAADIDALIEAILRLSDLAISVGPRLVELDVNPLAVLPRGQGVLALDALAVLS